jgi:hypothetical protein
MPGTLLAVLVLMAWDSSTALLDRFAAARAAMNARQPRRRRVGASYQGFIKAIAGVFNLLLPQAQTHGRQLIERIAGVHWRVQGWIAFAADGSMIDCPRTLANEKGFGTAGKAGCGPQLQLTMLWHMGTGLPWAWRVGRAAESEQAHLRRMLDLLPARALLVMDAGFRGFDLLQQIRDSGRFFLARVGANVTLLRELGYVVQERENTVYLWPAEQRGHRPLVLRLIRVKAKGGKSMCLITNVLESEHLSHRSAAMLYRMRWGVEICYRSLKETLSRRKMRSDAPRNARIELHGALLGLMLLGLMTVRRIIARGRVPQRLSVATALRAIRLAMRESNLTWRTLLGLLSRAVQDRYKRLGSRKARSWPHKKHESPPGEPNVRKATRAEIASARSLTAVPMPS